MAPSSTSPNQPSTKVDEGSSTPACDQCRARKIRCNRQRPECLNCKKAGVSCGFSDRGKRVNHTRQLIDDFSGLAARLDSIDQSIAKISQQLPSADCSSLTVSHVSDVDDDIFYSKEESNNEEQRNRSSQKGEVFLAVHQKYDDRGGERYYGCTAALSLLESSRGVLGELVENNEIRGKSPLASLVAKDASFKSELRSHYESFPFLDSCREPDFSADGKSVASPPRSFLDSVIDCFLNEINSTRPIFQESRLKEAIDQHYTSDASEAIEARSLCFSNIILLTLGLKSRSVRRHCSDRREMDDDLLLSFLKNSRRAFGQLDNYIEPRLINVQALATLAMVAREYCESQVFERLCQMACRVAKSMGLHRLPNGSKIALCDIDTERNNLFWALYVMDKERAFMTGQSCDLYFFDTDLQLLEGEPGCTLQHYSVAHYHMISIWEELYISLYSSRAARKGLSYRLNQVSRLSSLFRNWGYQYKVLLNAPLAAETSTLGCFQLELKYCFHVGQILIYRCGCEETNQQQRINSVYAALSMIKDIHGSSSSLGKIALLGRLFRYYPIVPFVDLFTRVLEAPDGNSKTDIDLLVAVAEAVGLFKDADFPLAYYSRLHIGMLWCIRVANTVVNAVDQPLTKKTIESPAEVMGTESSYPRKLPSISAVSSSSKSTRTPSQDDSPRPRKRPSLPQTTSSLQGNPQIAQRAQKPMANTNIPANSLNGVGSRQCAPLREDDHPDSILTTSLPSHHSDFQDWRLPISHQGSGQVFLDNPVVTLAPAVGEIFYEAGTFDNFMPHSRTIIVEPWEMDFTEQMAQDGFDA